MLTRQFNLADSIRLSHWQCMILFFTTVSIFINPLMPMDHHATVQAKPWTEEELYEARNWMPRASDDEPSQSNVQSRARSASVLVTSRPVSNTRRPTRPLQRVNLAELKAQMAAQIGISRLAKPGRPATSIAPMGLRHVGGHLGLGGGNLEGAGYSARSPYEALAVCSFSYYGFPVLYQGVAKGRDGYFAYKIYRR